MQRQDAIIQYLKDTYHPEGMIAYGSFADGSANEHSDFDALVIGGSLKKHDSSVIGGTVLDVFVYPAETFQKPYDPEEFVQIFDGSILLDENGHWGRIKPERWDRMADYMLSVGVITKRRSDEYTNDYFPA